MWHFQNFFISLENYKLHILNFKFYVKVIVHFKLIFVRGDCNDPVLFFYTWVSIHFRTTVC